MKRSIIFGYHAVYARASENPKTIQKILVDKHRKVKRINELIRLAHLNTINVELVMSHVIELEAEGARHNGVLAWIDPLEHPGGDIIEILKANSRPLLLALDGITDPRNLGACIRVAEAFGVHAIVVPKNRTATITPAARKVASGSADRVKLLKVTNLARKLKEAREHGVLVVGLSQKSETSLMSLNAPGGIILVLGGEESGLRRLTREVCDYQVSIPMLGNVESLNVSVAAGIGLYELHRQWLV